jgi:hypothetical protein
MRKEIETLPLFKDMEVVTHSEKSWIWAMLAEARKKVDQGINFTVADLLAEVGDPPGHYNKIGSTMRFIAGHLKLKEKGRVKSPIYSHKGRKIPIWGR